MKLEYFIWFLLVIFYIYVVISLWNNMIKNEKIKKEREENKDELQK